MASAFEALVQSMADLGVFELFFPWLLVLAVTYGALQEYEIFSSDQSVNGTIAIAVAFFSIGGAYYFLPQGVLTGLAAGLAFSVFAILGLMIVLAVAGYDVEEMEKQDLPVQAGILLVLLVFIAVVAFQFDWSWLTEDLGGAGNTFEEVVMPIAILIFLLLVVSETAGGGGEE